MSKIGCVIAYRKNHTNYGTSLVGYALLKKIQMLGFEVEVINYVKNLSFTQKVAFVWNAIRVGEFKNIVHRLKFNRILKKHLLFAKSLNERIDAVEKYKEKKLIPLFHDYKGYQELNTGSQSYDVVVVGSDQVWTPMSLPNKFFNLLFVDDSVKKVAYASSFGVSVIPEFQKKATGAYLDRFHVIGVREQKGKDIVESLSNNKATVVADPTMLLNAREWETEISDSKSILNEPYIFCFFLGTNPEARKAAKSLSEKTGFKIVTLRHMDEYYEPDEKFGDYAPYNVDPNDFLKLIHDAEYVCTDSFHCTAFSIQFHKQFMTFYRFAEGSSTGRNSRIDSLFNVLGIDRSRIYVDNINSIFDSVEWNSVDNKLSQFREDSIKFLANSLS